MAIIKKQDEFAEIVSKTVPRRKFMMLAGAATAVSVLTVVACKKDDDVVSGTDSVDLGSGDIGVLNYAYALEQLEAAFYTTVVAEAAFTSTFTMEEQMILKDIKDHEIIHREFLKAALGTKAIGDLKVDFSSINFKEKASVLGTAKVFEDLGVSAYNGAGKLIQDVNYLLIAGKIVSVEARHAAAIRDLLSPKSASFSGDDVVSPTTGLDGAMAPKDVLSAASKYIKTKINANNLPTS